MKKLVVAAVVMAGTWFALPAHAQSSPVEGRRCGFDTVEDPTVEDGDVHTGSLSGGPLVATSPGAPISMQCTIQVGVANWAHSGANEAVAASAATPGVTALPPTLVSYFAPTGQPVYICTQVTVAGSTYYWDDVNGQWSPSSAVACQEPAVSCDCFPDGPLGPILDLIELVIVDIVDPVACDILAAFAPGVPGVVEVTDDGDTHVLGLRVYDCPPYGS